MATYGLLIDYEYCTNCCACVVSCKEEHDYTDGQWGIKLYSDGPWAIGDGTWNWNWYPLPTDLCDLCADRTAGGREPICVHHCLSNILSYGSVEELVKKLADKPKQMLVVPAFKPMSSRPEFKHQRNLTDEHQAAKLEAVGGGQLRLNVDRHDGFDEV
jgi:anaerobic dimethyl sulfoxide reductase subunit B (iron-sulfur subunit)